MKREWTDDELAEKLTDLYQRYGSTQCDQSHPYDHPLWNWLVGQKIHFPSPLLVRVPRAVVQQQRQNQNKVIAQLKLLTGSKDVAFAEKPQWRKRPLTLYINPPSTPLCPMPTYNELKEIYDAI